MGRRSRTRIHSVLCGGLWIQYRVWSLESGVRVESGAWVWVWSRVEEGKGVVLYSIAVDFGFWVSVLGYGHSGGYGRSGYLGYMWYSGRESVTLRQEEACCLSSCRLVVLLGTVLLWIDDRPAVRCRSCCAENSSCCCCDPVASNGCRPAAWCSVRLSHGEGAALHRGVVQPHRSGPAAKVEIQLELSCRSCRLTSCRFFFPSHKKSARW